MGLVMAAALLASPARARADDATPQARAHYEMGLKLFDARQHDQALIEFDTANQLAPRPAALFMMAQCEYLLGRLKEARTHYERYASENPDGEFVELAKDRIQSIGKRPGTFAINTVPGEVDVRIVSDTAPEQPSVTGQAPNNFPVPRGRYRITASKLNYVQQTRVVDIDLAETKPLFFKLEPIPARLEVETLPAGATLYVNGNRARNPYRQDVVPGHYEIFAEAADQHYLSRSYELSLEPGERRLLTGANQFTLKYVQRSGNTELIVASAVIGGAIGAAAVAAAIGQNTNVTSVLFSTGGGITGVIVGALAANALVPKYIPDNRALFVIGGMWIGAAEGAGVGIAWEQTSNQPTEGQLVRAGFIGSLGGLAVGMTSGALLSAHAPTYGRVAVIQSAALGGCLAGALVAISLKPYGVMWERNDNSVLDLTLPGLVGLNAGLAAGLLAAYLPDQSKYGPAWRRTLLIDLAAGAGAVGGAVAGCVANVDGCATDRRNTPDTNARAIVAAAALGGGVLGLLGGVMLTRHSDDDDRPPPPGVSTTGMLMPIRTPDGHVTTGVGALGVF
jgi:hypothetical protein